MTTRQEIFLVHLSDLHVGRFAGSTGTTRNPFACHHHFQLASGLTRTVDLIGAMVARRPGAVLRYVVSGDLTATGAAEEFANAQTFIGSRWLTCFNRPSVAGLGLGPGEIETVPGNHDHWGGLRTFGDFGGVRPPAFRLPDPPQFRPTPWSTSCASPEGSLELELFGLDTNSGMTGRNYLAKGALSRDECEQLEAMLAEPVRERGARTRVRAVLMHHSPSHDGRTNTLAQASTVRLVQLCQAHRVSAVLCGDVHTFRAGVLSDPPRPLYELRSPTTMQGPPDRTDAGFLLHRISMLQNGGARWQTYLYKWATPGPAFNAIGPGPGMPVADFGCA